MSQGTTEGTTEGTTAGRASVPAKLDYQSAALEAFKEKLKRDVLFPRRLGGAEEFATLAAEILANSYMNAEVIRLDGGARLQPK